MNDFLTELDQAVLAHAEKLLVEMMSGGKEAGAFAPALYENVFDELEYADGSSDVVSEEVARQVENLRAASTGKRFDPLLVAAALSWALRTHASPDYDGSGGGVTLSSLAQLREKMLTLDLG